MEDIGGTAQQGAHYQITLATRAAENWASCG